MGLSPINKRRTQSPEFKARIDMETTSGRKTIQGIAGDHPSHPGESVEKAAAGWCQWAVDARQGEQGQRRGPGKGSWDVPTDRQAPDGMEKLKNLSCSVARVLRKLVDPDHPELSLSSQCGCWGCRDTRSTTGQHRCVNRRTESWTGSMFVPGGSLQWQTPNGG